VIFYSNHYCVITVIIIIFIIALLLSFLKNNIIACCMFNFIRQQLQNSVKKARVALIRCVWKLESNGCDWLLRAGARDHVTMLNHQTVQRAQPPPRSSSLRSTSSSTAATDTAPSKASAQGGSEPGSRLAVELQRLHELKKQVAAQEQRLATLRNASTSVTSSTENNRSISSGNSRSIAFCMRTLRVLGHWHQHWNQVT